MNGACCHGYFTMGDGGGPTGEGGAHPMTGGEVAGHIGVALGHAS
jgi:hypothetical protein